MGTHNTHDSAFPIIQEDMNVSGGPGLSKLEYAAIEAMKAAKALLAELEKEQ